MEECISNLKWVVGGVELRVKKMRKIKSKEKIKNLFFKAQEVKIGEGFPAEFRQNPVSLDWVIIATGRAKRPSQFKKEKKKEKPPSPKNCPFCDVKNLASQKPVFIYLKDKKIKGSWESPLEEIPKDWQVISIPNKYPALFPAVSLKKETKGIYQKIDGVGFHEVVIFKDHWHQIADLEEKQVFRIIDTYKERFLDLKRYPFINYVAIFTNWGKEAGASVFHPHSQIIGMPIIDPDLNRSLKGAKNFYKKYKKCVHCEMIKASLKEKERIIFENKEFVVLAPFASTVAFELRIYPKKHLSYFEEISLSQIKFLAEALKIALFSLKKALNDPSYNFFIHSAPCDEEKRDYYHWHLEIYPKTSIWAGFELCTGIQISTIKPEDAAKYLRKVLKL